jgi:hypothetical protein
MDYAALEKAACGEGPPRRARRVRQRAGQAPPASSPTRDRAADVYGTHHIGASTDQAQEAIAAETVRIVRTFVETGSRAERREPGAQTPATHMLVVRHRDRPGVLAHVFDELRGPV